MNSKKEKIISYIKLGAKFIPALTLIVIMILALVKTDFDMVSRSEDGDLKITDLVYVISMILMIGATVAVPLIKNKLVTVSLGVAALMSFPFFCFYMLEYYVHDPFDVSGDKFILNILIFYFAAIALTLITTRSDAALAVTAAVPMIFGMANYLALEFRDAPVFPWDLQSAGVAMSVLDNYKVEMTPRLYYIIFFFVFMIGFAFLTGFRFKMRKIWMNAAVAVVAFAVTLGFFSYLRSDTAERRHGYYPYLFSASYLYKTNGTALSFIYTTKYLKLDRPSGYSVEELQALYDEYKNTEANEPEVKPNIIVIMNEGFCDLSVLGDFTASTEYMPFISSLEENTIKGNVYVSVKGGNTPNSEFEFLTGTSMAYLPTGSIPYQQYINTDTLSMATQLKELGYTTAAMHPYGASGWERDTVYPLLGFDEMYFSSDFKGSEKIRGYYSDLAMYKKYIDQFEEARENGDTSPKFFFGVTMQNHGSYNIDYYKYSFKLDVTVDELPFDLDENSTNREIATYLSLIKRSDEAFEYLVSYFEKVDEPTVILMFGDHQPNDYIAKPILKLGGIENINTESLETKQLRWQTPYVMWSNYELENANETGDIGLNYLGTMLLKNAGIPLTPFQSWLSEELFPEYPIINANCFVDKNGEFHSVSEINSVPLLKTYAKLQYNLVFDTKNTVKELFSYSR